MKNSTNQNDRAAQIWSILVLTARHQEVITYATIAKLTGLPSYALGPALDRIADYCRKKKLPDLWTLIVNEKTGFPGKKGMARGEELDILCNQHRVFAFNWFSQDCPQAEDFKPSSKV
jgi:alkylated DNA nucleotide flippase Atl1